MEFKWAMIDPVSTMQPGERWGLGSWGVFCGRLEKKWMRNVDLRLDGTDDSVKQG